MYVEYSIYKTEKKSIYVFLSVTAYIIALLHVGPMNVVYLKACAFIRS